MKNKTDQLEQLAKPIAEWIKKNGNPYTQVIITADKIRVTEDMVGIPLYKQ